MLRLISYKLTTSIIVLSLALGSIHPACASDREKQNQVAEALVQKIERGFPLLSDPEVQKDGFFFTKENSRIVIFRSWNSLPSILKNGFQNQYTTRETRGSINVDYRKKVENTTLQTDIDQLGFDDSFRAKYGIVLNSFTAKGTSPSRHYGMVAWILKPEVMKRSTWAHVDSLELGDTKQDLFWPKSFQVPFDFRAMLPPGTLPKHSWNSKLYYSEDAPKIEGKPVDYVEAQVWGNLSHLDVEQVAYYDDAPEESLSLLKEKGIKTTHLRSATLATLLKGTGLPETKWIPPSSHFLNPTTYEALALPPKIYWYPESAHKSRPPEVRVSPEIWFKDLAVAEKSFWEELEKTKSYPSASSSPISNALEHPYMSRKEGIQLVRKSYREYVAKNRADIGSFANSVAEKLMIQYPTLTHPEGREMMMEMIRNPSSNQHDVLSLAQRIVWTYGDKAYYWRIAPEIARAAVSRAQQDPTYAPDYVANLLKYFPDYCGHLTQPVP